MSRVLAERDSFLQTVLGRTWEQDQALGFNRPTATASHIRIALENC